MEKKKRINRDWIIEGLKNSLQSSEINNTASFCAQYGLDDFTAYIKKEMRDADMERLEDHCMACRECAQRLIDAAEIHMRNRVEMNHKWREDLLNRIDQERFVAQENVAELNSMNIMLRFEKGSFEIAHSSEGVQSSVMTDSSKKAAQDANKNMRIVQRFESVNISVQAVLSHEGENRLKILVSLYDNFPDDYIEGVTLELCRAGEAVARTVTGKHGDAFFYLVSPNNYDIKLIREHLLFGNISLVLQSERQ